MHNESNGAIDRLCVSRQITREPTEHIICMAAPETGSSIEDGTGGLLLEHHWPPPDTKHFSNV